MHPLEPTLAKQASQERRTDSMLGRLHILSHLEQFPQTQTASTLQGPKKVRASLTSPLAYAALPVNLPLEHTSSHSLATQFRTMLAPLLMLFLILLGVHSIMLAFVKESHLVAVQLELPCYFR